MKKTIAFILLFVLILTLIPGSENELQTADNALLICVKQLQSTFFTFFKCFGTLVLQVGKAAIA